MAKTLKDFLNERQLGPMVVKNPDEQKFIDKHVVAKTDDRNGNDDELFKGSKVKMADRPKHRKGYNPGEDEEVYEELKGNQHKIDANKNGKVDAHDFHLLRKKKKVAEEAEDLDESAEDKHFEKQSPKMQNAINLHLRKGHDYASAVKAAAKHVKEEAEQIDELSTEKLLAYRKKAKAGDIPVRRGVGIDTADEKINKKTGVYNPNLLQRAKAKLRNEEAEELEELSKEKLTDYRTAAKKQGTGIQDKMKIGGGDWSKDGKDTSTLKKRLAGYKMAGRKTNPDLAASVGKAPRVAATEEVQIDEISSGLAQRYLQKKSERDYNTSADGKTYTLKKPTTLDRLNRDIKGTVRALKTIEKAKKTNEEVEQIDELSIDTMKSYGDKRARTAFSGGRKPGQSVDAGIKTKSRQINSLALSKTKINRARDTGSTILNKEEAELQEKLDMKKASMGTVVKDFQKSDAPQFMGKSQKKRQVMAIAAKLSAERGDKPLNKEERLLVKLADISETHQRTMISVFEKLNEDNQYAFMQACDTADGIEQMLDFSISYRGE